MIAVGSAAHGVITAKAGGGPALAVVYRGRACSYQLVIENRRVTFVKGEVVMISDPAAARQMLTIAGFEIVKLAGALDLGRVLSGPNRYHEDAKYTLVAINGMRYQSDTVRAAEQDEIEWLQVLEDHMMQGGGMQLSTPPGRGEVDPMVQQLKGKPYGGLLRVTEADNGEGDRQWEKVK